MKLNMKRIPARYVHKTVAALLLPLFATLTLAGLVRAFVYDVPMLRGDYALARQSYVSFRYASDSKVHLPGDKRDIYDSFASGIKLWYEFVDLACGDRVVPLFNEARRLYRLGDEPPAVQPGGKALVRGGDYAQTRKALQAAFAACCAPGTGKVRPQYSELASDIQVLIGNTYDHEEKSKESIPFYEAALAPGLNPNNLTAVYNIERQPKSTSGKSKDSNQPTPQSAGGKPKGKL